MSGGGGYPPGPFGGDPFGGGGWPSGGEWPGAPNGPAPQQPPPPEANTLATLSVVFAVVLAPVGAVLGHLALSQIKKRPQPGHTRALIGVTLSYVLIVLAVVAVVVWAVLPSRTSTPSSQATSPTTTKPTAERPIIGDAVKAVLLDGPELAALFNQRFEDHPSLSFDNSYPLGGNVAAAPAECLGTAFAAQGASYPATAVKGHADQVWNHPFKVGQPTDRIQEVREAVVALPTAADAANLFAQFSRQWKRCDGQTVTDTTGDPRLPHKITEVRITDSVLAATVQTTENSAVYDAARAIGIQGNCLVDVSVSFYLHWQSDTGSADPQTSGTTLTQAMMDKAKKHR